MENARGCLVAAVVAQGTKNCPETEERRPRRLDTPDTGLQRHAEELPRRHHRTRTAIL